MTEEITTADLSFDSRLSILEKGNARLTMLVAELTSELDYLEKRVSAYGEFIVQYILNEPNKMRAMQEKLIVVDFNSRIN